MKNKWCQGKPFTNCRALPTLLLVSKPDEDPISIFFSIENSLFHLNGPPYLTLPSTLEGDRVNLP